MAYRTVEQKDACEELRRAYGYEDRMAIEDTQEPYGVVLMVWFPSERRVLIRPDGSHLSWRTL